MSRERRLECPGGHNKVKGEAGQRIHLQHLRSLLHNHNLNSEGRRGAVMEGGEEGAGLQSVMDGVKVLWWA